MSQFKSSHIGKIVIGTTAMIASILIILIIAVMVFTSLKALTHGETNFLSNNWDPSQQSFGMIPMFYGTIVVTLIALIVALPIGILSAAFLAEVVTYRWRLPLKSLLELLAGIPSIVYGLIAIAVLSPVIENIFTVSTGRTLLLGGLVLALMILPTLITLCDDAFLRVPRRYRESAYGLGLNRWEVFSQTSFPMARSEVIGVVLLATGRALGETMAVMLVVGSIDRLPDPLYNFLVPGQTITSKIGREIAESSFGSLHFSALTTAGLVLLIVVLLISFISQHFTTHDQLKD